MNQSLRDKQLASLKQILNFNLPISKSSFAIAEPEWKVLILDRFSQELIVPLFSVKELRDLGVTLHLQLHSDREPIVDVPAVYLCHPSTENIERICRDCADGMYENYHFNFIGQISRSNIEKIANDAIRNGYVKQIIKIFDQYVNFISLEDDLFILRHLDRNQISYQALNRSEAPDEEIEGILNLIVDSLFAVCVSLGQVPIIRCQKDNAAEMVATMLDKRLKENLKDTRNNLFCSDAFASGALNFQRPVMLICDRNLDLASPLHHTWTYQALVHECLNLQLNRVQVTDQKGLHTYELRVNDKLWQTQKDQPFVSVAEVIQEKFEEYKSSANDVKKLKAQMGLSAEDDEAVTILSDSTGRLTDAVNSLPELVERKNNLNMHMNIATAVLEDIKRRKLDTFYEMEEKILSRSTLDKSVSEILRDSDCEKDDKMRLFLVYLLMNGGSMSPAEMDSFSAELEAAGCNMRPLAYVKRWLAFHKISSANYQESSGAKTVNMLDKFISHSSQLVMDGVKNFAVKSHKLPLTKLVEACMENKQPNSATDDLKYFDPRLFRYPETEVLPRVKTSFNEAVVFVVGGGTYIEYQNIRENLITQSKSSRQITYGCSSLMNGSDFLKQFTILGEED